MVAISINSSTKKSTNGKIIKGTRRGPLDRKNKKKKGTKT
jgi:hypothetical protein